MRWLGFMTGAMLATLARTGRRALTDGRQLSFSSF